MTPRSSVRLNVHLIPSRQRFSWSLSAIEHDSRGVPSIRLLEHGSGDLHDLDLVGLPAVAQLAVRAVYPEA